MELSRLHHKFDWHRNLLSSEWCSIAIWSKLLPVRSTISEMRILQCLNLLSYSSAADICILSLLNDLKLHKPNHSVWWSWAGCTTNLIGIEISYLVNDVASPFGAKCCQIITLQKGKTSSSFHFIDSSTIWIWIRIGNLG